MRLEKKCWLVKEEVLVFDQNEKYLLVEFQVLTIMEREYENYYSLKKKQELIDDQILIFISF